MGDDLYQPWLALGSASIAESILKVALDAATSSMRVSCSTSSALSNTRPRPCQRSRRSSSTASTSIGPACSATWRSSVARLVHGLFLLKMVLVRRPIRLIIAEREGPSVRLHTPDSEHETDGSRSSGYADPERPGPVTGLHGYRKPADGSLMIASPRRDGFALTAKRPRRTTVVYRRHGRTSRGWTRLPNFN